MRRGLLFLVLLSELVFLMAGCAQTVDRIGPQGTGGDPYFRPKRVYAVDMNRAWDLTLKALNREGISLEMANKEMGLIRTDYQNLSPWERSKCDLRLSPEPQGKTFIYVRCLYEGRKEAAEPFRDFTYSSPREVMKTEEEMYRKIEPYILPFEQTPMVKEEVVSKVEPQPPPPPAAPTPPPKPEAALPPTSPAPTGAQPQMAGVPIPKMGPSYPKPEAVSPAPPPAVVEVKPRATGAPLQKGPPAPPVRASPKKPEIMEESLAAYLTTIEAANVRLAPSTLSKIIAVLTRGEKVERVGETGPWIKVKLRSGETAWIFSAFVQGDSPRKENSAIQPSPARRPSPDPCPPDLKTAAVRPQMTSPPPIPQAGETVSKKGVDGPPKMATKAIVRMRAEPSSAARVVLVLKKGREVEKIGESGPYTQVKLSWGDTGWVLTRSLQKVR